MTDPMLARKMRRYMENNEGLVQGWGQCAPPETACRKCVSCQHKWVQEHMRELVPVPKEEASYSSVLVYASRFPEFRINRQLKALEGEDLVIDGVTIFCPLCCSVSVISYQYDCLVKSAVGEEASPYMDAYYARMLHLADTVKRQRRDMLAVPAIIVPP